MNKSKKTIIIIGCITLVLVISIVLVLIIPKKRYTKQELNKTFEELGAYYYENDYYQALSSDKAKRVDFLKKYEETGFKVSIENLERSKIIKSDKQELINQLKESNCDFSKSIVKIIPKKNYEVKDYSIKTSLICEEKK